MSDPQISSHVVITGHGRSGTNMVLDLFGCHCNTFCRNEPNELVGSAFTGLGDPMFGDPSPQDFADRWRKALTQTVRSAGTRDRFSTDKDYFRGSLRARIGQAVMARGRLRSQLLPAQDGTTIEEWPCPKLYYDHNALARTMPVLKILLAPAWVTQAHTHIPTQHVVHVVRRPEGFLQSWWSRYVTDIGGGPEQVFADNQPSLKRILTHFNRPDEMPSDYSLHALLVSELWRWRYMNEILAERLSSSSRYMLVGYETVMRDKLVWAEKLYAFADLEMTAACRAMVTGMQNTLFRERKPDGLDSAVVKAAMKEVVTDSPWLSALDPKAGQTPPA